MNNIEELIRIIEELNGNATIEEICFVYLKEHKMMIDNAYLQVIETTLMHNLDKVVKNPNNKWSIKETKNIIEQVTISTKQKETGGLKHVYDFLNSMSEVDPDIYDGCYEPVRTTINEYSKLEDFSKVNVDDMNFLYSLCVGTWKMNINVRKNRLKLTNLSNESRELIKNTIDKVWNKSIKKEYVHEETEGNPSLGMFGTGFMTFSGKLSDKDASAFIKMCTEILDLNNEDEIFSVCEKTINNSEFEGKGLQAAALSIILYCLKPYIFPILNRNVGYGFIYSVLDIDIKNPDKLKSYIDNCRVISKYRNENYTFKNYRIFDVAAWFMDDEIQFESRERNIRDLREAARKTAYKYTTCKRILSANPLVFDHKNCLQDLGYIEWRENGIHYDTGDIIYLYASKNIHRIVAELVVIKTNMSKNEITDSTQYWKEIKMYDDYNGRFMRVGLLSFIDNEGLDLKYLLENGLNAAPQVSCKINDKLASYILSQIDQ